MTPHELELIVADGEAVRERPDPFANVFYATLFELAPATRSLFPDDLVTTLAPFDAGWMHGQTPHIGNK